MTPCFFNAITDIIKREINKEREQYTVTPCQPYERQTGPKRIEERLPPPIQNKIYRDEAVPIDSLGTLWPMSKNTNG